MSDVGGPEPLPRLDYRDFAECIDRSFDATTHGGERLELRLIEATQRQPGPHMAPGFSLEFRIVPDDGPRAQQTVVIDHPTRGAHAIFLVPVERDEDGTIYQSVFSFLPDASA